MKKKLKKISLFAGLLCLCGAFGLSLFLLDHKKAESTYADFYIDSTSGTVNTSYENEVGSNTGLSYDYTIDVSLGYIENLGQRYIYNVSLTIKTSSAGGFSYSVFDTNYQPYSFDFMFNTLVSNDLIPTTLFINFDIFGGSGVETGGGIYGGVYSFTYTTYVISGTSPIGSSVSENLTAQYRLFNSNNSLLTSSDIVNTNVALPNPVTSESQAYLDAYNTGFNDGYQKGNNDGYTYGYDDGYSQGVESQQQNITDAYNSGYSDGYDVAIHSNSTVASIFSGILQVGLLPINFFLAIFNFEILGINLSGFIRALFTIAITIIVVRTIFGGKGASD